MVLYGIVKKLPKSQAMALGVGGGIAISYLSFAFNRYTGRLFRIQVI
jgi:hypothetical protein